MFKKNFMMMMVTTAVGCMPLATEANEIESVAEVASEASAETDEQDISSAVLVEPIETNPYEDYATTVKYGTEGANIYSQPNDESEILGVSNENTTFDAVKGMEAEGWTTILSNNGLAYMHTAELKDHTYTQDELDVLAHVICGECQCYPDQEQLYVGSVVLNRVKSSRYPNSIRGVVFQKGQYACTWDGNYYRTPTDRNWANAKHLLEHGSVLPDNVVYQSGGRQGKGVYVKTKWHYYCY